MLETYCGPCREWHSVAHVTQRPWQQPSSRRRTWSPEAARSGQDLGPSRLSSVALSQDNSHASSTRHSRIDFGSPWHGDSRALAHRLGSDCPSARWLIRPSIPTINEMLEAQEKPSNPRLTPRERE